MPGRRAREDHGLWPEHVAAFRAFLAVCGQWHIVAGMSGGRVTGLDYARAQAGFALAGFDVSPDLWSEIRLIEAGAVEEMNRGR